MRDVSMPGDWLFKVVPWFIGTVFVILVLAFIGFGVLGVKAVKELDGCTPALVTTDKDGTKSTSIECKKQPEKP